MRFFLVPVGEHMTIPALDSPAIAHVTEIGGALVTISPSSLSWSAPLRAIDADGAPRAYNPGGRLAGALDLLGNAGKPGDWWALVCGADGQPIVQGPSDPAPGFYVSTTALQDHGRPLTDPRRYVDSSAVPYLSAPPELLAAGCRVGDVGVAVLGAARAAFVIADVSPHGAKLCEGSVALALALGVPSSPVNGGSLRLVEWTVYRASAAAPAWPRALDELAASVARLGAASEGA